MILDQHLKVGCKLYSFGAWVNFSEEQIAQMDADAGDFWTQYRASVVEIIKAARSKVKRNRYHITVYQTLDVTSHRFLK